MRAPPTLIQISQVMSTLTIHEFADIEMKMTGEKGNTYIFCEFEWKYIPNKYMGNKLLKVVIGQI